MATALFLATFVFVAYVLYSSVFGEQESATKSSAPAAKPKASEKPKPAAKAKAVEKVKVAEAPKAESAKKVEPAKKAAATAGSITLKNPATGETASVPTNYRFAKRWIKEAMVSEGLLDKIYKNNELEGAVDIKTKAAVEKLKAMKKYHA
ncbi:MAG: hypothetical protein ACU833_01455 [Gammaproteobacteria bacterium]